MTNRVYNFGAGPCTLPLPALEKAQQEFVDFKNSGMSLFEMSHRSKEYDEVHHTTMSLVKEIYGTPDEFEVIFIQGGATLQFSMVPMNLLKAGQKAAYVHTGYWAKKAIADAKLYADLYLAWNGTDENYVRMPSSGELKLQENTRYVHITSNETIGGIRYTEWPDVNVPLVADMSSDYLSRSIPWEKFDIIYGGTQKNLAPSGMSCVFIRKSIIENTNQNMGAYLRYDIHTNKESLYNTPPVFPIYMMGLGLKWVKEMGGLNVIEERADKRASIIYDTIDNSDGFYNSPVEKKSRSVMNIVFTMPDDSLNPIFIEQAKEKGMIGLKGHRSVGGLRASCYNAMPIEGAEALAGFMKSFMKEHRK